MDHHEGTQHGIIRSKARKRLLISAALTFSLFVVEFVGGLLSNSLALLSDAGHMLGDVVALTMSLLSIVWATKQATEEKTFGYYRAEVLATLINGALLLFVALQILWEAFTRIQSPEAIRLGLMLPIAVAGLIVNFMCMILLRHHTAHLVTRSAFYHVLSDMISSICVILAGLVIYKFGWRWVDPGISLLIATLIARNAYILLKEAFDILMEGSPSGVPLNDVKKLILGVPGVEDIHDLHVWTIGSGFLSASAHVMVREMSVVESDQIIARISSELRTHYAITHTTLQVAALPRPAQIQTLSI